MTPEELAEIEAKMAHPCALLDRRDATALCAEVRRLKDAVAEALTPFAELIGENDRLRHERDAARAEVARLREALDAAQRIVRRKADRERGFEDCRACEALGYHGSNERCEAHR